MWVQLEKDGHKLVVGNIYREWDKNQGQVIDEFLETIESFPIGNKILVAGDFNIDPTKLKDKSYNSNIQQVGKRLLQGMAERGFTRHSAGATFHRLVLKKTCVI